MHVKSLFIGVLALGLAAMLRGEASATAAYGPCLPSSVQVVFNGQQLYIGCRSPVFYFDAGGALRSANNIALNLSNTTATAFNSYVSVSTAALLSGKSLYIWPNFGLPATSDLVYFQDLSIQ